MRSPGVALPNAPTGKPVAFACLDANNRLFASPTKCTGN